MLSVQSHPSEINVTCMMDSRKQQFQVPEVTRKQRRYPPIGPEPLLLSHNEIDELYCLLEVLHAVLNELRIEYTLIGGSLLGAVRSESILFNDYDVDIAIIDDGESYERLKTSLSQVLEREADKRNADDNATSTCSRMARVMYEYQQRPWIACDRVKSTAAPNVSIDLFVFCKYETRQDLTLVIERKDSSDPESRQGENKSHTPIPFESSFPLYHYDNRTAIKLKSREYFTDLELRPLRSIPFGPLSVSGPSDSIGTLERFFGKDCFTHFTDIRRPSKHESNSISWEEARRIQLSDEQYRPVQSSPPEGRIQSNHSRRALENTIALYREETESVVTTPPSSGGGNGMMRSRSLFALGEGKRSEALLSMESESAPQAVGPATDKPQPTKWFGKDVRRHIGETPETPVFGKELRAVMEPHLRKARKKREACRSPTNMSVDASIAGSVGVPYTGLRDEKRFLFDEHSHSLHQVLADTLGVEDLSQLHNHPIKDKQLLLAPLLTPEGRRRFHESYDHFVTWFCIPLLHSLALTKKQFQNTSPTAGSDIHYRYQAFPCLRIVRPGEFSIGPHCDTAYGHSIGNLNFHVPLTPTFGTNALYTESHPGKEDWHGLTTKSPGLGYLFDGARCLHFTMENTTDATRVSIDFRIAIFRGSGEGLCAKELLADRFSNAGPGYYDEASIRTGVGSFVAKKDGNHLFEPDARVGFPFTKK